ncbi:MAG: hypothetical protein IKP11_05145 [Paludibacteraceae bacterium]|nr:hypothetical protein [Paludibacteraceae bacterium]
MSKFDTIISDDIITAYKYQQTTPYSLYIEKDLMDDELVIEFTGKILGVRYTELINQTNIRQCLDNINALGLCSLNTEAILNEGGVVKADVTIDAEYPDMPSLTKEIQSCIKNNERYNAYKEGDNFIVEKKVKTKNRKLRLTIYDKEKEMNLSENKRWLYSFGHAAADRMMNYFKGKVRFEMNLNSIKAIKDSLQLRDNSLTSVMSSDYNPIMPFLDKVLLDNAEARTAKTMGDMARISLMEKYNYDLKAIERLAKEIRDRNNKSTNLSQTLKPYHELYNALHANKQTSLKERLKGVLLEIFLIGFFVSM